MARLTIADRVTLSKKIADDVEQALQDRADAVKASPEYKEFKYPEQEELDEVLPLWEKWKALQDQRDELDKQGEILKNQQKELDSKYATTQFAVKPEHKYISYWYPSLSRFTDLLKEKTEEARAKAFPTASYDKTKIYNLVETEILLSGETDPNVIVNVIPERVIKQMN